MARGTRAERGAILIWSTFAIFMVAVLAAVVVNIGHLTSVRGELQNAVDAGALAGARELSGMSADLSAADTVAEDQAGAHGTNRHAVVASDVRFGAWVPPNRTCDPQDAQLPLDRRDGYSTDGHRFCEVTGTDPAAAFRVNAVYVRAQRNDAAPGAGAVPMLFGRLLGRPSAAVTASAIAVTGGPCGGCNVQVPWWWESGASPTSPVAGEGPCAIHRPEPTHRGRSTRSVSRPLRCARLAGRCSARLRHPSSRSLLPEGRGRQLPHRRGGGRARGRGAGEQVQRLVQVGDAELRQDHLRLVQAVRGADSRRTGDRHVRAPSEACPSNYVGRAYIVGYATYRVLAVNCTASASTPTASRPRGRATARTPPLPAAYASGKCVLSQLVCNHRNGANHSTGCAWTGTSPLRPILVR